MTRYFTVAEANALLPALRPHVATMVEAWKRLSARHAHVIALLEQAPRDDRGGPLLAAAAADIVRSQNALFTIQSYGAQLKDPATGLIDFPSLRDGVPVFLSWRYGEERVQFWHPAGSAGPRHPIEDE